MLLAGHLRKILLSYDNQRKTAKVLKALRVLKAFTLQLPHGSSVSIDIDALTGSADSGNLQDDVTDLLLAAGEAAVERDGGILLAVDEVQYLSESELAALVTAIQERLSETCRSSWSAPGCHSYPALLATPSRMPRGCSNSRSSARSKLATPGPPSRFRPPNRGSNSRAKQWRRSSSRHAAIPYFLQEWGYHVWNEAEQGPVRQEVVDRVTPRVVAHLDTNFFLVRFDRLTPAEKKYLRAMAELGPGPHRSGDIAAQLGVKVESVAPRRSGLISKGMIYSPAHGDTAFTVPLFDEFLRRALPGP